MEREREREGEAGVTRKWIGGGKPKREGSVLRLGRKECEAAAPVEISAALCLCICEGRVTGKEKYKPSER